jgi:hypothetical protein
MLLPLDALSAPLNMSSVSVARTGSETEYNLHVSDVIETSGPRAFCAREHVLAAHTTRDKRNKRITPARQMLFATGHFLHDYVVRQVLANSPYARYVYADWSCADWTWGTDQHDLVQDTYGNVITKHCKCGKPFTEHHELELKLQGVVGHPDIVFLIGDTYRVREFKTYERNDIPFDDLVEPLPGHRLQLTVYWKMLWAKARKEGRKVSPELVVEYIDRSNSKLFGGKPFKSIACRPYDDIYTERIRNSIAHFNNGVRTGRLPDRICSLIRDRRARECDHAVECFQRRNSYVALAKRTPEHSDGGVEPQVRNRRRLRAP